MTRSEKRLGTAFLGILVVGILAVGTKYYLERRSVLNAEYFEIAGELDEMRAIVETEEMWKTRGAWVSANLPKPIGDEEMDLELSKLVGEGDEKVEIKNLQYFEPLVSPHFNMAKVRFNANGQLVDVMTWLHSLILRERFLTINYIQISQDEAKDDGTAKCSVELRKYYGK